MSRAASTALAAPGPWIVGPRYDQLFLWGAWCVPLVLWGIAVSAPVGIVVAVVAFVLLDNAHQVATLPLTVLDPATMTRAAPTYLGGAAAIGGAAVAVSFFPGTAVAQLWASLVVYWGAWHIIRQHYGFLRLYQARDAPRPRLARAEIAALYSGSAFPYALNLAYGWAADDGIGKLLYRVPLPPWAPWPVLAVFGLSLGYVVVGAFARARRGEGVVNVRLLHLLLVVSNFWIGLLWIGRDDLLLAVLFITSYHDVQYHAVVWLVGTARAHAPAQPVRPAVRRMFASTGAFVVALLVGAVLESLLRNDFQLAGSVLPQSTATAAVFALFGSYSYVHYFFDGKMWKLSRDPRLRAELGVASRRPA